MRRLQDILIAIITPFGQLVQFIGALLRVRRKP